METHAEGTQGTIEWRGFRLSWGAIVAGLVIATVVQVILGLLGVAIGFGTVNFQTGQALESFGIGAGIWAVATALISLFVGGLAAGHLAGALNLFDGVLHGVLVWGLSTFLTLWALGSGVGTLVGGVFGAAGQTLSAAVGGAGEVGAALVRDDGQAIRELTRAQNREQIASVIQERTQLNQQEAREAADALVGARQQFQLQAEEVRQQAPQVAEQVAGTVSTAAWWALLATILSLAAAAGGAAITARE